jgi:ABC-type uncharacterized transport system auxiliary subunit
VTTTSNLLSIIALSCAASACSGLLDSKEPADRIYWLEPWVVGATGDNNAEELSRSLMISVAAAPGLDTDRLLVLESDAHLNHFASARWPEHIPEVLESLLRTTLESTRAYSRVKRGALGQSADLHVALEVRELFALATDSDRVYAVRMALNGYLDCDNSERAIMISAEETVQDTSLSEIVAAYQRALDNASQQLVEQMAGTCPAKYTQNN